MHKNLYEFLSAHIAGVGPDDTDGVIDAVFFKIRPKGNPDPEQLRDLIGAHPGHNGLENLNLFDGKEHSYIEIGAWLGDQGSALQLMALGSAMDLWRLLTPMSVLGLSPSDPLTLQMAGMGYLIIKADRA